MNEVATISQTTVKRLLKDVKTIIKNPLHDNGIYYQHDNKNMLKGYAMIIGPTGTPYEDGFYFFKFDFPTNYPYSPPKLTYCTNDKYNTRFNPNLYRNGKVCISILNTWKGDQWTSCQSISSILLTLCTVLNDKPLLNEPHITEEYRDFNNYNYIITYRNFEHSILYVYKHPEKYSEFHFFYEIINKHYIDNESKIISKIKDMKEKNFKPVSMSLYDMQCTLNYTELLKKYEKKKRCAGKDEKKNQKSGKK